jgi:hypothetical protein
MAVTAVVVVAAMAPASVIPTTAASGAAMSRNTAILRTIRNVVILPVMGALARTPSTNT